ncbi:hypothetical protein N7G274_008392 [Stereocaulon virgatum]|uniref:Uncharacterized protein n=1 Tax=Stereocaulon virgatum TaxID=373712 RepID=A0ABR3ZZ09_9LECA
MTKLKHPSNPTGGAGGNPSELGRTRTTRRGMLEYLNPMTGDWQAAVRLQDIRDKLLRDEDPNQYTIPKKHGNNHGKEPTNYTSFLLKDKEFGPERENRPQILFQINNAKPYQAKPIAYMMVDSRIVLDMYDHGLRDFPDVLPKVLSSELEGHDIEYYYRQNAEIMDYDLIARMPHAFHHGTRGERYRSEPMRGGTINQRAQRFRTRAACISWNSRAGTGTKNDFILSLIPSEYKAAGVNSTRNFRDFNDDEVKAVNAQDRGIIMEIARDTNATTNIKKAIKEVPRLTSRAMNVIDDNLVNNDDAFADDESVEDTMLSRKRAPSRRKDSRPRLARAAQMSVSTSNAVPCQTKELDKAEQPTTQQTPLEQHTANMKRKREDAKYRSYPSKRIKIEPPLLPTSVSRRTVSIRNAWTKRDAMNRLREQDARFTTALPRSSANSFPVGSATWPVTFDPETDQRFKSDVAAGIARGDVRYIAPYGKFTDFEDKWDVNRALELTRIDCSELCGYMPPDELWSRHQRECYASHYLRLCDWFNNAWRKTRPRPVPIPYRLPEWHGGFGDWNAPDRRGKELKAAVDELWNTSDESSEDDTERETLS